MTGPAAVAWAARLGWLRLGGTGFGFLAGPVAVGVLSLAAVGEFVGDKLPKTPARTAPGPFAVRAMFGALGGAALALGTGGAGFILPAAFGAIRAVLGTLGGYAYRTRFVTRFKAGDPPFALAEDLVAVGLAILAVRR